MKTAVINTNHFYPNLSISWTALGVGSLLIVGLSYLMRLFTVGVGLSAYTTTTSGTMAFAITGFVCLIILSYLLLFLAGWITGLISSVYSDKRWLGLLHGFAAWCLALVIMGAFVAPNHPFFIAQRFPHSVNVMAPANTLNSPTLPLTTTVSQNQNTVQAITSPANPINTLGIGMLATFFIFLSGILGSSLGGYYGVICSNKYFTKYSSSAYTPVNYSN